MTDNTKMREAFERWAEGYDIRLVRDGVFADDYADGDAEIAWRAWQAAQAVPVVGRNQCDGCNRGLQVCDDGLHREPSGHPVMACTRSKYTTSIPAQELAALRRCKELLAEARDDVAENLNHMLALAGYPSNDRRISKQRELLEAIDAAIAAEGEKK